MKTCRTTFQQRFTINEDFTCCGLNEPSDQGEQNRLAAAVRPCDADNFAGRDMQINAIKNRLTVVRKLEGHITQRNLAFNIQAVMAYIVFQIAIQGHIKDRPESLSGVFNGLKTRPEANHTVQGLQGAPRKQGTSRERTNGQRAIDHQGPPVSDHGHNAHLGQQMAHVGHQGRQFIDFEASVNFTFL